MTGTGSRYAELTPPGRGAIATVAVWGEDAQQIVQAFFAPANRGLSGKLPNDAVVFGRWAHDAGAEDVVVSVGRDVIEVHCHGGEAAIHAICQALLSQGVAPATAGQWLEQTHADSIAAEAHAALGQAATERTAAILLDQYHGALTNRLAEAEQQLPAAEPILKRLLDWSLIGQHLTHPWRVVLAGAPNVGKSSLANRLLGYERAIVFDRPGTTRDVLTATTAVDGWPIELFDTAGFRNGADSIEQQGVEQARQTIEEADLVLIVRDATTSDDASIADQLERLAQNSLTIFNKGDLVEASPPMGTGVLVSAKTGQGVGRLWELISMQLVPESPKPREAIPFLPRHIREIRAAHEHLRANNRDAAKQHLDTLLSRT